VIDLIKQSGLSDTQVSIQVLNADHQLKIFFSETSGITGGDFIALLKKGDFPLSDTVEEEILLNWVSVSGQLSSTMKQQAGWGLALALLAIFLYITLRFEWKYALSATLGLAIDLTVVVSCLSILHHLGVSLNITLETIAALMTMIGYSLNDTIIVFDRIRDEWKQAPRQSLSEVVNRSLRSTLTRTIMTSTTTLGVLLALLFFGGSALFNLSLVMALGVVFGTFSSLFLAPVILILLYSDRK
ncbi:MAG: protein translocase subunit SecF, partial [Chlamydiota bacterium]|nr:protein translocase subunit SecF [Chlamydiota bacterium]